MNVLTTDLAEARAAKPRVVQQPQVAEQPQPQATEQPRPVVRPPTTAPDELKVLSKSHFLATKEKTIEIDAVFSDIGITRRKATVKQDGDSIVTTYLEGSLIDKYQGVVMIINKLQNPSMFKVERNRLRINGDYLEVETVVEGRGGFSKWEKQLKIDANPGERWEEEIPIAGGGSLKNEYRFVGFEKIEGTPFSNATVECISTMSFPKTGNMEASTILGRRRSHYREGFGLIEEERSSDMGKGGEMQVTMRTRLSTK